MSKGLKVGTGEVTEHKDNRQNERGAGVSNTPLAKSGFQPEPPRVNEGKSHAAAAPKHAPQAAEKKAADGGRNTINYSGIAPKSGNTSKTFTAPRKEGGQEPMEAGFTKLGKA